MDSVPEASGGALRIDWRTGRAGRYVELDECRRCGALILIGLDADITAREVHADATPIDLMTELGEIEAGRGSWDLVRMPSGRCVLVHRDESRMRAPKSRWPVLRTHRCIRGKYKPRDRASEEVVATPDEKPPF